HAQAVHCGNLGADPLYGQAAGRTIRFAARSRHRNPAARRICDGSNFVACPIAVHRSREPTPPAGVYDLFRSELSPASQIEQGWARGEEEGVSAETWNQFVLLRFPRALSVHGWECRDACFRLETDGVIRDSPQ